MRKFELVIVLDGKATAAKKKSVNENLEKFIKDAKGSITESKDLGTKDLAYQIGKSEKGAYYFFALELESSKVKELAEKLRLSEDLIRYLLINKEK